MKPFKLKTIHPINNYSPVLINIIKNNTINNRSNLNRNPIPQIIKSIQKPL